VSRLGIALLSILGFLLMLYLSLQNQYFRTKYTDFKMFYAGARLAGSPQLYESRRIREVFYEATGQRLPDWATHIVFSRMPWVAEALAPLGKLSYPAAFWTWQVSLVLAAVAFLAVSPYKEALPFAGLSLPLINSWVVGQDSVLLLLFVALALRCCSRGRHVVAGLLLSLCVCNKPHLFVFLPLLLWSLRLRMLFKGLVLGSAVLTGISFLSAGWAWPAYYYRGILQNPSFNPWKEHMTSLASVPAGFASWLALLTVALVWWALRQTSRIDHGVGLVLVGSLLVAPHSYVYDHSLLLVALPPFLTLGSGLRLFTGLMLLPVVYLVFTARDPPWPAGAPLLLLAWLGVAAWKLHASPPSR
jgi:hypothetical protein